MLHRRNKGLSTRLKGHLFRAGHQHCRLLFESLEHRYVLAGTAFLHVHDSSGDLGVVDVTTGDTTVIGDMGPTMWDIAFSPTGELFAVTPTSLYQVDPVTADSTLIDAHGVSNANALVFDEFGALYTMSSNSSILYTLDPITAQATAVGDVGSRSAGDLAFVGGELYLASSDNNLVRIQLSGNVSGTIVGPFGVSDVLGLATPDNETLYATAGTSIYEVDLTTGNATLSANYAGMGLGQAFGSSFFGESGGDPPAGTISGVKFNDINGNGIRDQSLIQGNPPHVVFVIDNSLSADFPYAGTPTGDVNGDGKSDTRLDAELSAFLALNQELVDEGFGSVADVSVVTFHGVANSLDMSPGTGGNQLVTAPLGDSNGNGVRDVEETLLGITTLGSNGTNFEAALSESLTALVSHGAAPEDGSVVFISDGDNLNGGPFEDEAEAIRDRGSSLRAFGAGDDANLVQLQNIDPEAQLFSTTDELLGIFGGLLSPTINYQEPGLQGWTIFLDDDNDGMLDAGEVSTITNANGEYAFFGLLPGTYTVAEVQQPGWTQTAPFSASRPDLIGDFDFEDGSANNGAFGLPHLIAGGVTISGGDAVFDADSDFLELPQALGNTPFTVAIDATYDVPPVGQLAIAISQQDSTEPFAGDPQEADFDLLQTANGISRAAFHDGEGGLNEVRNTAFDGARHFYGITWDGLTLGSYFDGQLASVAVAGTVPDIDGDKVRFGAQDPVHLAWGPAGMTGRIHGLRIFGSALSEIDLRSAFEDQSGVGPHVVVLGSDASITSRDFGNQRTFPGPETTVTGRGREILDDATMSSTLNGTSFGSVPIGGQMSRTYNVRNDGDTTLVLDNLAASGPFSIAEGLSGSLGPGESDAFTVQIDTSVPGFKNGQVSFGTNDADENPFNFAISGTVVGASNSDVVINELDPGTQDAVELYNAGPKIADLTDWQLVAKTPGSPTATYTLPPFSLSPGEYVVLHETTGTNSSTDLYFNDNIWWAPTVAGSAALLDGLGQGIDFVRWSGSAENPPPPTGWTGPDPGAGVIPESLGRDSNSTDTDSGSDWTWQDGTLGGVNQPIAGGPTIIAGNHTLAPNSPGQTIQILVTGGTAVQGLNLNLTVEDGFPNFGSSDGPNITSVDVINATVFAGNNNNQNTTASFDQAWVVTTTTNSGTVDADGLLATVTLDTTGFFGGDGPFDLFLTDPSGGPSDFAGIPATLVHGSISIADASVVGSHVFYNASAFDASNDDAAIAPDKVPLLPGQSASFANYTSYSGGLNGILVDILGASNPSGITASDFEFRVGNNNIPSSWPQAPLPITVNVRAGDGPGGSDRVALIWDFASDGTGRPINPGTSIRNQWLQVTVKPTGNTGLADEYVFYFGNAIGESGNSQSETNVNATDEVGARNNPHNFANPANINDIYDFNRDRNVNATDEIIARNNGTNFSNRLQLISPASSVVAPIRSTRLLPLPTSNAHTIPLLADEFFAEYDENQRSLDVHELEAVSSLKSLIQNSAGQRDSRDESAITEGKRINPDRGLMQPSSWVRFKEIPAMTVCSFEFVVSSPRWSIWVKAI